MIGNYRSWTFPWFPGAKFRGIEGIHESGVSAEERLMVGAVVVCLCALVAGVVSLVTEGRARRSRPAGFGPARPVPTAQQERAREILYAAKEAPRSPRRARCARATWTSTAGSWRSPGTPRRPRHPAGLGMTYQQLQDFDNAAWAFDEIIRRFPTPTSASRPGLPSAPLELPGNQEKIISPMWRWPRPSARHGRPQVCQSKLKLLDIPMPAPLRNRCPNGRVLSPMSSLRTRPQWRWSLRPPQRRPPLRRRPRRRPRPRSGTRPRRGEAPAAEAPRPRSRGRLFSETMTGERCVRGVLDGVDVVDTVDGARRPVGRRPC
jgi:hypothetical protein